MKKENINSPEFWDKNYSNLIYQDAYPEQFEMWKKFVDQLDFENRIVLEIGCGLAQVSNYIYENKNPKQIIATDQSSVIIEESKKRYSNNFLMFVMSVMDYKEALGLTFHDVIAFEILEHFHNPENVLRNIFKALPEGGRLIFSVPQENGINDDMDMHYSRWDYNKTFIRMFEVGFSNIRLYTNIANHNQILGVAVK